MQLDRSTPHATPVQSPSLIARGLALADLARLHDQHDLAALAAPDIQAPDFEASREGVAHAMENVTAQILASTAHTTADAAALAVTCYALSDTALACAGEDWLRSEVMRLRPALARLATFLAAAAEIPLGGLMFQDDAERMIAIAAR